MATIIEKTQAIMEQLQAGEFVKGMEDFYADGVVIEEVTGAKTTGKAVVIEKERKILEGVAAFHGTTVRSVGGHENSPGNGTTFAEYAIRVDMKDGSTFNPTQVQVMDWEDGLATHVRFYYDPAKL